MARIIHLRCVAVFVAACAFLPLGASPEGPSESRLFGRTHSFATSQFSNVLLPSPSQTSLAAVSGKTCWLFTFDEGAWTGPLAPEQELRVHGMIGRPEPWYQWVTDSHGREVFEMDPIAETGVALVKGKLESSRTAKCHRSHNAKHSGLPTYEEMVAAGSEVRRAATLRTLRSCLGAESEQAKDEAIARVTASIPWILDNEAGVYDIDRSKGIVLFYRPDREAVAVDVRNGREIPFPIHGRPRVLPGDTHPVLSPDGEWVLVRYSYSPDDHYSGGYLQLFTNKGEFVTEVASFRDDVGAPIGQHVWLDSDWIVYHDGANVTFLEFTGNAPAPQ